jgi:hypothetical protein
MPDAGRSSTVLTHFAPAGRADPSRLADEAQTCLANPVTRVVLESLDGLVMVLNSHRQILAATPALLKALEADGVGDPLGLRPGEAVGCIHAAEGPEGCGTSRACRCCGAVLCILAAQDHPDEGSSGECLLSMKRAGLWKAAEFQVHARSVELGGSPCTILVLHDISAQKRKETMESLFFHDVLNLLQGLQGWSEILQENIEDPQRAAQNIIRLSQRITSQVMQQRIIQLAEQGQLQLRFSRFSVVHMLEELAEDCRSHQSCAGKSLEQVAPADDVFLETDPDLLFRVLLNMGVNALEAVPEGGRVVLRFEMEAGAPTFQVWNAGHIPDSVATLIFQRSFSTKEKKGRGLGTYAMKLLGENHLGGRVAFQSSPEDGTTFSIQLPLASLAPS